MVHLKRFESCRGNVSRRSLFHKAEALPREILSKTLVFYFSTKARNGVILNNCVLK